MGHLQFHNKKPMKNKLFYLALAGCLIAFGISSYTAVSRLRQLDQPDSSSPESTASLSQVDKTVSDVPYPSSPETPDSATDVTVSDDAVLTEPAEYFLLPLTGEVLKDFDSETLQYSETYKDWRLHLGVDLSAAVGDAVTAAANGTVEDIYADPQWGTVVVIDHGNSLMLFYCGLNQTPTVQIGQSVKAGDQLGVVDTIPCESVEQPHLHLSAEQDGVPVSPLAVMGLMG
ncbi:MAG: M23 family metallopeptidase [Clostridia bacterium]|nr:M23 family metallopeptidase [Clostridia bacterium]